MPKPTPGRIVLVLVHPDSNNGRDELPTIVTGVNDDGTCNGIGQPDTAGQTGVDLRGITVVADRKAALAELGRHTKDLVPVRNTEEGEKPYKPVDAAPWVRVGFWPPRDEPAGTDGSKAPPAKKTAAKKAPAKTAAPAAA